MLDFSQTQPDYLATHGVDSRVADLCGAVPSMRPARWWKYSVGRGDSNHCRLIQYRAGYRLGRRGLLRLPAFGPVCPVDVSCRSGRHAVGYSPLPA